MVIGSMRIMVEIPGNDNLKGKRRVVKGLIERLRNKFNVSVSEIDHLDKHQIATLGVALVSNDAAFANKVLSQIINFVEAYSDVMLLDYMIEII
ncbi:MAG: DUF503 domain-containing protein [Deferribacteres bacterium]|nr:DUF503 domain-containing protein [Deferribacteres bacterium]